MKPSYNVVRESMAEDGECDEQEYNNEDHQSHEFHHHQNPNNDHG